MNSLCTCGGQDDNWHSKGCPVREAWDQEVQPDHPTSCDCCGINTIWSDTEETGSFGPTGRMCKQGLGCQRKRT